MVRFFSCLVLLLSITVPAVAAPTAILQGLDKITAQITRLKVPINHKIDFGTLSVTVRQCAKSKPLEPDASAAFIEVEEQAETPSTANIFRGWLYAAEPSRCGLEHPIYDIVLLGCE